MSGPCDGFPGSLFGIAAVTIEFSCTHCNKPLSTGDDKAGRKAKCPGCGEPVEVPTVNTDGIDMTPQIVPPLPAGTSGAAGATTKCPMCGYLDATGAAACPACGETLEFKKAGYRPGLASEPVAFDLGEVLSRSWQIFKQELGLVVGGQLISGLLGTAAMLPGAGMLFAAFLPFMDGPPNDDMIPMLLALGFVGFIAIVIGGIVTLWLNIGAHMLLLGVVRGKDVSYSTLFEGRRFLLRSFGCTFIYNIMVQIGQQLCTIPGLLVIAFFWPFQYLIIDDDLPNIQALLEAPKLASKSFWRSLVLMIVSGGLLLLGLLALGVGLIFAGPFVSLVWCVAYDEMRGGSALEDEYAPSDAAEPEAV